MSKDWPDKSQGWNPWACDVQTCIEDHKNAITELQDAYQGHLEIRHLDQEGRIKALETLLKDEDILDRLAALEDNAHCPDPPTEDPEGAVIKPVVTVDPPQEQPKSDGHEDFLEAAYWSFDAMHKGLGKHKGRPQSERDAFKMAVREMLNRKPPQEPPKGYWWCETHECISTQRGCPESRGDGRCRFDWREQPQPKEEPSQGHWECTDCGATVECIRLDIIHASQDFVPEKPDEPPADEGMKRYIKMPVLVLDEVEGWVTDQLQDIDATHYDTPYICQQCTATRDHIKPHPISEEVLRLRHDLSQWVDVANDLRVKTDAQDEEIVHLQNKAILKRAECDGIGSQMLDIQQDCIAGKKEIEQLKAELGHEKAGRNILAGELSKSQAKLESSTKTKRSLLRENESLGRELRQYRRTDTSDACNILAALDTEEETNAPQ